MTRPALALLTLTLTDDTPSADVAEYAANIFWVVGFALVTSWVVAVAFTPYLGVKLLPNIKSVQGGHAAIYNTPNYRCLRKVISWAVRHKFVVSGAVVIALVLSVVGMGGVKQQFFPTDQRFSLRSVSPRVAALRRRAMP